MTTIPAFAIGLEPIDPSGAGTSTTTPKEADDDLAVSSTGIP